MKNRGHALLFGSGTQVDPGQVEWTAATSTTWQVPLGVTSISAVCVQGGDGGLLDIGSSGGDLRYITTVAVTPLETLNIVVGAGGGGEEYPSGSGPVDPGVHSSIKRGGTTLIASNSSIGGVIGGGNGGAGGSEFNFPDDDYWGGGGGGAGGYSGNGGHGAATVTAGSGGGGGGGGRKEIGSGDVSKGRMGGGVGLKGAGANGIAAVGNVDGGEGSGGTLGIGGGGGGGWALDSETVTSPGRDGNDGGIRIIWGDGRAYPSTGTADV
jgi:hypothetical protein